MNEILAILRDLEQRIAFNGGNPVAVKGEHWNLVTWLEGGKYDGLDLLIGRAHLPRIRGAIKRIERVIVETTTFRLNPVPWVTSRSNGGRAMDVQDMETSHIANTIRMIKDGRMHQSRPRGTNGLSNAEWLHIFNNELLIRKLNKQ